jgi:N-acetylglucosamine-6-phosphate deacetylase
VCKTSTAGADSSARAWGGPRAGSDKVLKETARVSHTALSRVKGSDGIKQLPSLELSHVQGPVLYPGELGSHVHGGVGFSRGRAFFAFKKIHVTHDIAGPTRAVASHMHLVYIECSVSSFATRSSAGV